MLFGFAREMVAYGIMGLMAAGGVPAFAVYARRRRRERLRRRGVKRFGH